MGQIDSWTDRVWRNKLAKDFNTTNIDVEFNLTYVELAEAYEAYARRKSDVGEELADVMIFLLSLAKMLDVDLEKAFETKMAKNESRAYKKLDNGFNVKIVEGDKQ